MAMNKSPSKTSKSLYSRSMKMVASFVRLSSFSTAKTSPGAPVPAAGKPYKAANFFDVNPPPPPPPRGNLRSSHELQRRSNPVKYMIHETVDDTQTSGFVVGEEENVDGMASDYIRKVHEKNKIMSSNDTWNLDLSNL